MNLVSAVIPPYRLEDLRNAVMRAGAPGMTVSEVRGFGRQRGHTATYRGAEYDLAFVPKLRVEILVAGSEADRLAGALVEAVRTGKIGDGKVWVTAVDSVTRIRTGEVGVEAL